MNNLIKNKSDKMSLHEHKIVSSIENNGINLTNLIYAMNENLVCGFVYTVQYYFNSNSYLYVKILLEIWRVLSVNYLLLILMIRF